jgi:hypothetical protein
LGRKLSIGSDCWEAAAVKGCPMPAAATRIDARKHIAGVGQAAKEEAAGGMAGGSLGYRLWRFDWFRCRRRIAASPHDGQLPVLQENAGEIASRTRVPAGRSRVCRRPSARRSVTGRRPGRCRIHGDDGSVANPMCAVPAWRRYARPDASDRRRWYTASGMPTRALFGYIAALVLGILTLFPYFLGFPFGGESSSRQMIRVKLIIFAALLFSPVRLLGQPQFRLALVFCLAVAAISSILGLAKSQNFGGAPTCCGANSVRLAWGYACLDSATLTSAARSACGKS